MLAIASYWTLIIVITAMTLGIFVYIKLGRSG